MTPEGEVKREVKKIFKKHDVLYFMYVPGGWSKSGISDFVCCVNGWYMEVETKATHNIKPTPLQKHNSELVTAAGGIHLFIHGGTLQLLENTIIALKRSRPYASSIAQ